MPKPTRWTPEARKAITEMVKRRTPQSTIEQVVGLPWKQISERLEYHARLEALAAQRASSPAYDHLRRHPPIPESATVESLYAPRVEVPERLRKYAGKAYG